MRLGVMTTVAVSAADAVDVQLDVFESLGVAAGPVHIAAATEAVVQVTSELYWDAVDSTDLVSKLEELQIRVFAAEDVRKSLGMVSALHSVGTTPCWA